MKGIMKLFTIKVAATIASKINKQKIQSNTVMDEGQI